MAASPLRIVLLGKAGSGKSSLANTIFKEDVFQVDHTANACQAECCSVTKNIDGTNLTLIDTLGLFDQQRSEDEQKEGTIQCLLECVPGPNAFLIVLKKENYTSQEDDVMKTIFETFSDEALKYSIIVFTRGDDLQPEETIEQFVEFNADLRRLYNKCGRRCFVVDNKYWKNSQDDKYRNNEVQVKWLLDEVKRMAGKGGKHYTNPVLEKLARTKDEVDEATWKMVKKKHVKGFQTKGGVNPKMLLGALLGSGAAVAFVMTILKLFR